MADAPAPGLVLAEPVEYKNNPIQQQQTATTVVVAMGSPAPHFDDKPLFRTEHFERYSCPLCCITCGSDETTVRRTSLAVRKNHTCCCLPVCCGAGYSQERVDPFGIIGWATEVNKCCCCISCTATQDTTTGHGVVNSKVDRATTGKFNEAMTWATTRARGQGDPIQDRSFQFTYRCGLANRILRVHTDGLVTMEDTQADLCCGVRSVTQSAFLDKVDYIKYTKNSFLGCLLCCESSGIDISLDNNVYRIDQEMNASDVEELNAVLLKTVRHGTPMGAVYKANGAFGNGVSVAPDFTTVTYRPWFACLCSPFASTTVLTFRTERIAYVKASMMSCTKVCAAACDELDEPCFEMRRVRRRICGVDIAMCLQWPCACAVDICRYSGLAFQTFLICLIFPIYACVGFCCRRSSVVLGAPGPRPRMVFPGQYQPEEFLNSMASAIEQAQAGFTWPPPAPVVRLDMPAKYPASTPYASSGAPKSVV